jgi:prepilin-type N-terminal cleavage/methylation domain-containing protein
MLTTRKDFCRASKQPAAFTLVELLVVIGIIALLMSILLPALNSARRSANAVKCAAQLRDLGNAFRFYSIDNRNYYPACNINGAPYEFEGDTYPKTLPGGTRTYGIYWFNFINKYVTKTKLGVQTGSVANSADARKSIIWGCNQFDGYATTGLGTAADLNPVQPGYGMNPTPFWQTDGGTATPNALDNGPATAATIAAGKGFIKATAWGKMGAQRCLLMDSALYQTNANKPTANLGLFAGDQNVTVDDSAANAATAASIWRHGKHPSRGMTVSNYANNCWYPTGNDGKVAWNILYCDGHVNTESDAKLAYSTVRMKFPG